MLLFKNTPSKMTIYLTDLIKNNPFAFWLLLPELQRWLLLYRQRQWKGVVSWFWIGVWLKWLEEERDYMEIVLYIYCWCSFSLPTTCPLTSSMIDDLECWHNDELYCWIEFVTALSLLPICLFLSESSKWLDTFLKFWGWNNNFYKGYFCHLKKN